VLVTTHNIERVMARVSRTKDLTWDLETTGLFPHLGDRLFGLALEADGEAFYFGWRHKNGTNLPLNTMEPVLDELTNGQHELLGFNSSRFDSPMVAAEGERFYRRLLHDDRLIHRDVMVAAMMANENEPSFSLDALGQKYLGAAAGKRAAQDKMLEPLRLAYPRLKAKRQLYAHLSELTPEQVAEYACDDVLDTRALWNVYVPNLEEWELLPLTHEMFRYSRLLAKIQWRGLLIDRDEAARRVERCIAEQLALGEHIRRQLGMPDFNPNSPAQVCRLLGTPDAEADTVRRSGHPLAEQLITYKQLGKMASTYYEPMRDKLDAAGCVHPQMNMTRDPNDRGGTRSCRLSCSNPNFQNLPKRSPKWYMLVRELVKARPGRVIMANDYERAEMWMGGHYSGDQSLFDAYHANRDLYTELAQTTETDRQGAKIDWLAIQYGVGPWKLAKMHGWPFRSIEELSKEFGREPSDPRAPWGDAEWRSYKGQKSVQVRDTFFEMCPGIKHMMTTLRERAETVGSLRLWTGRVIHFDGFYTRSFAAWNRLIQGGVGEMMRVAMQRLEPVLDHYGADMLLQVHDEIVTETPEEHVAAVRRETRRIMCDFDFRLRPRVDQSIGRSYGKVEKLIEKEAA
jgi:DNA polymerase I-like protein with 3'-5' exonuclease and polymerase domains